MTVIKKDLIKEQLKSENREKEYFKDNELAFNVWNSKYRYENESPDDTLKRISNSIAENEFTYRDKYYPNKINKLSSYGKDLFENISTYDKKYLNDLFYDLIKDYDKFIPGGSILATLGTNKRSSLSNCYVVPQCEDNISSIIDSIKAMANIFKFRGGAGIDISKLRPRDASVNNSAKTSSGAVSFLELFSANASVIGQEGRRAAQMIAMSDRHPDIQEFITIKSDLSKISGANLSVQFSKELQNAAINNEDWILCFPTDDQELINADVSKTPYNKLIDYGNGRYIKKVRASELFDLIIDMAWKNAEPGILLKSNILEYDPSSVYDNLRYVVSNPCGEQPLAPWDSCRLGSVNLYSFVKNKFTSDAYFDFENFYETVYKSILFMDNIIDCEINYLSNIINTSNDNFEKELWSKAINIAKQGRRIGLGFTALGDAIAAMNLNFFDSKDFVDKIMSIKMESELNATVDLGILKGSFESFDINKEYNQSNMIVRGKNEFYRFIEKKYPDIISRMIINNARRNVSFSTVAPNGSLSLLASKIGTTSGIEPLFKALYIRRRKVSENEEYDFKDPYTGEVFKEYYIAHGGLKEYCNIIYKLDFNTLTKKQQIEVFESSPYYRNQAEDLSWQCRLDMQEVVQKYTSSAISTTINLKESISKDVIKNIYINAYQKGLKGCTVFRNGSRSGILVNSNKKDEIKMIEHNAPKRPTVLPCDIYSIKQKGEDYICAVGLMNKTPYEIFVFKFNKIDNKKGFIKKIESGHYSLIDENKNIIIDNLSDVMIPGIEDLTRGYSYGLRHSGQIKFAVEQLQKSKGSLSDFSKVLARTLKKYIKDGEQSSEKCNKCGSTLVFENGCKTCKNCGESYCG